MRCQAEELKFGYRHLELKQGEIVVAARFNVEKGTAETIQDRLEVNRRHRQDSQKISLP